MPSVDVMTLLLVVPLSDTATNVPLPYLTASHELAAGAVRDVHVVPSASYGIPFAYRPDAHTAHVPADRVLLVKYVTFEVLVADAVLLDCVKSYASVGPIAPWSP